MATQRQPAVRPAHSGISHRPSSAKTSKKNTGANAEGGAGPQSGLDSDHREKQRDLESEREVVRQAVFQRRSNKALKLPNGYLKVAVLIIRWDRTIDDFKGHTEEIERLQNIFEHQFRYTCKVHSIKNLKKPQVDLNRAILNHIFEYDDPNNLLIFYYTGHGDQSGVNDLELSANQDFANTSGSHLPTAFWNSAEEPIRWHMEGDALSILDCCMASTAGMKCRNGLPRTYQLLAASAVDAPTCGPGDNSFTTALCVSLIELLDEAKGGTFLLTQLCERINTKRKSQACLSWDRLRTFKRTVQLGRLEQSANLEDSFINEDPEQSSLLLRLSFKTSDLENGQIERLAEQLPHACHEAQVPLRRIDWVRMEQTNREITRNPNIHHNISFATNDESYFNHQADRVFDTNHNDVFEAQPTGLHGALRAINAAQRWRSRVKRKHGSKRQLPENTRITLSYVSGWVVALKLFCLVFTFGLLFLREEKTKLALWSILVVSMLLYGPCGIMTLGKYVRWERDRTVI